MKDMRDLTPSPKRFERKLSQTILTHRVGVDCQSSEQKLTDVESIGRAKLIGGAEGHEPDVAVVDGALDALVFRRLQEVFAQVTSLPLGVRTGYEPSSFRLRASP